jgi:hypothetical protein
MNLVLPFEQRPSADHAQWDALFQQGGPLDDRGPFAHYRGTSRHTLVVRYGRWIKWLEDKDPQALSLQFSALLHLTRRPISAEIQRSAQWLRGLFPDCTGQQCVRGELGNTSSSR